LAPAQTKPSYNIYLFITPCVHTVVNAGME